MEKKQFWMNLREEDLTEETKTLISSLPSEKEYLGGNLCKYQGSWYYYNFLQGVLNVQRGFQPQDTDVIVASFPKCGTLWLKALTVALFERSKNRSSEDQHPLFSNNPHNLVPVLEMNLYRDTPEPDLTKLLSSSPRLFSTHMPFLTLKEALKDSPCKVVYICRDAKDSLVSRWHIICRCLNKEEDRSILESMFESFCSGVCLFGPFWDQILSYWKASLENPKRVLFMKYDEVKIDTRGQLKRLAEFLGCPFSEEEENNGSMDGILEMCSLASLSSLEVNKTGKSINGIDYKKHFRKGIVGDWKNYLTPEMGKKIDMIMEEKLKDSGLKF
ncbi:Cytosolic sulfotransferase 3 [Raphanus sativus]|uniref:Sulfotransferase n=1 Tax=Raphanus sativus TaxID=3726 RepID=A0A6J0M9E5_RAPSA|nr:cytosolic sulfotransferase 3-like [Raphanus sativus]KAJ4870101.1 Cytosolic sulfotransferase 3 [Raphanus sativus]